MNMKYSPLVLSEMAPMKQPMTAAIAMAKGMTIQI